MVNYAVRALHREMHQAVPQVESTPSSSTALPFMPVNFIVFHYDIAGQTGTRADTEESSSSLPSTAHYNISPCGRDPPRGRFSARLQQELLLDIAALGRLCAL
jgi:hypothetical protein